LFEPDRCRRKMQESDEMSCEFFIASGNASKPLEFVDKTFDDVAIAVADAVLVAWLFAIAEGSDDRLYLAGCEPVWQRVKIVAFAGNNGIRIERGAQLFSLGHVMALTPGQDELEGKPRASTRRWILLLNPPRLRPRHCSCCGPPFLTRPLRSYGRAQLYYRASLLPCLGPGRTV